MRVRITGPPMLVKHLSQLIKGVSTTALEAKGEHRA